MALVDVVVVVAVPVALVVVFVVAVSVALVVVVVVAVPVALVVVVVVVVVAVPVALVDVVAVVVIAVGADLKYWYEMERKKIHVTNSPEELSSIQSAIGSWLRGHWFKSKPV